MQYSGLVEPSDLFSDHHVHTFLCGHAQGSMEEYVLEAVKKGLRVITFLEHMEEGIVSRWPSWLSEEDFDYYFSEGRRLQQKYADKIRIRLGVECGYNSDSRDRLRQRLAAREWDEIGISCHFLLLPGEREHINLLSKREENLRRFAGLDCSELFRRYIANLSEAVTCLNGTVLCHLDAALRWVPGHRLNDRHYQEIDDLLALISARGMALEINTSGIAIRGEPFPNRQILGLAKKHDLRFVLSSDAHKPEDVGNHFSRFQPKTASPKTKRCSG
ncbi:MAG: restriction endonuclease [Deltaproteobacteria bacterium]|nr:MAG: restriction endonuclease [Deltaproteobacteria bacterium]